MARSIAAPLLVGLTLACSGPPAPTDAGSDAGQDAATFLPTPVAEAMLPRMTCPDGWSEEGLGSVAVCNAFGGPRLRCTGPSAHFPGETGCRTIGTGCPVDGLPADMPADAIFVLAGSVGGDGTRGSPLGTIEEALAVVPEPGTIAVGVGRYDESVRLAGPIALRGACPDAIITNSGTPVTVSAAGVEISNLTIEGAFAGLAVRNGGVLVTDVFFLGNDTAAFTFGGDLELRDIVVRDTRLTAFSASVGTLRLERFAIEALGDTAFTLSSSSLDVRDGVIDGIADESSSLMTFGASTVTLERFALRSTSFGEIVVDESMLSATDIDSRASGTSSFPRFGITGVGAATIELTRVFLEGSSSLAVGVGAPGATLRTTDCVFLETRPSDGRTDGHAIEVGDGASAFISRTWIERAVGIGLLATSAGTSVTIEDLTVRDTLSASDGSFGRALQVQSGAHVMSSRTLFADNREASVVVATPGSRWDATDVAIEDSAERGCATAGCPPAGIGVSVFQSGSARVERFRILRSALVGAQVAFDGSLVLTDGEVAGCPIGANVQVPGYDIALLMEGVVYRDNGINLDATELAIPEPVIPDA